MVVLVPTLICRNDACPPTGEKPQTMIRTSPDIFTVRSWESKMMVLVSDELLASVSRTPMRSPLSSRQTRRACVARPTMAAKSIGNIVGP